MAEEGERRYTSGVGKKLGPGACSTVFVRPALALAAACLLAARAAAQEARMGGPALPGPGGASGFGDFARVRFDDAFGRAGGPTITEEALDANVVVSSTTDRRWSVEERFGHLGLSGPVQIPGGGPAVPRSLWSEDAGARYERRLESGRAWGAFASLGSDSDKLFTPIHAVTIESGLDAKVPSGERNAWRFSLTYSNNRYFFNGIALPGVAYEFRTAAGDLRGLAGFPWTGLYWTPAPRADARLVVFGPRRVYADSGYRLADRFRLHGGFDWGGQTWQPVSRPDYRDLLEYERMRLYAGVETTVRGRLRLDAAAGRQFDQKFFEAGPSVPSTSAAGLPPSWFLSVALDWRFGGA
jgi:hypothetical protein